jgi:hypothetical protein
MSKKCKYALKALVRLGKEYGKGNLLTDDIARSASVPKKFLELILLGAIFLSLMWRGRSKQGTGLFGELRVTRMNCTERSGSR